jgi:hypothetical protein
MSVLMQAWNRRAKVTGVIYVAIGVLVLASANNTAYELAIVTCDGLFSNIISTVALWISGLPIVLAGLMIDWPPQWWAGKTGASSC